MGSRGRQGKISREVDDLIAHRAPRLSVVSDAPSHLRQEGAGFFTAMRKAHSLDGPAAVEVLTRASECLDQLAAAHKAIAKDGEIIENQYGVAKLHPALVLEKSAR